MKTKPFLLATAGSTVDGRVIDDKMLTEMASSYNPTTYGARLNIEHIRGISGDKPFRSYGDVLELSTGEVEVDFNGKKEKRLGLYGTFDVTEDAKALNSASQKVYPSIEIEPNFGGKGFAYMMGCALTDSPAAIGTERLQFNRSLPGTINLTADKSGVPAAALELAVEETATQEAAGAIKGFFSKLTEQLGISGTPQPPVDPAAATQQPAKAPAFDAAKFAQELGETLDKAFAKQNEGTQAQLDSVLTRFAALETRVNNTADPNHRNRPPSDGQGGTQGYSLNDIF